MADVAVERRAQMFPKLSEAQVARIAVHAERRSVAAGELIFDQGQTTNGIHIVLSGALEIVRPGLDGDDPIVVHHAREFTAEVNALSGRRALVRGRMLEAGDVLFLDFAGLRRVVQEDSEISDLLMRAFILRR